MFMPSLESMVKKWEKEWTEEKATEAVKARDAIVKALKEERVSLPAAVFALDIIKWELLRAEYEEFVGHAKIGEGNLPLSTKEPT
jgi:hypothetical protein